MNTELKSQWVASLRSGEYKQTIGALRRPNGFCCLGVACDLVRDQVGGEWQRDSYDHFSFCGTGHDNGELLPFNVADMFGIMHSPSIVLLSPPRDEVTQVVYLTALNDEGFTFDQIADLIEYFL